MENPTLDWALYVDSVHRQSLEQWRQRQGGATGSDAALDRKLHQTIAGVGADIEALSFNKAVASCCRWFSIFSSTRAVSLVCCSRGLEL